MSRHRLKVAQRDFCVSISTSEGTRALNRSERSAPGVVGIAKGAGEVRGLVRGPHRGDLRNLRARDSLTEKTIIPLPSASGKGLESVPHHDGIVLKLALGEYLNLRQ